MCFLSNQDQLSADMYSFVAKEIDYASYFQTVSPTPAQAVTQASNQPMSSADPLVSLCLCPVDRSPGRVPQEIIGAASVCFAADQSSSG